MSKYYSQKTMSMSSILHELFRTKSCNNENVKHEPKYKWKCEECGFEDNHSLTTICLNWFYFKHKGGPARKYLKLN